MKAIKENFYPLMFLLLTFLVGCSDGNDNGLPSDTARISVSLTDAPGDYDAVNIDIQDVLINYNSLESEGENDENDEESGWQSIGNIEAGVYNLLELTGGLSAVLADNEVPAGKISQIRLLLGDANTIVIDGETKPLKTPSAMQSGLKVKVNEVLEPGFTYDFLIDFDVDKSVIIEAGSSDNINLQPVLYASTMFTSGKIEGSVTPVDYKVMASIENGEIAVAAYADENGVFVLNGVPEGTYDVVITPEPASGLAEFIAEGVVVENGEVTSLETIALIPLEGVGNVTGMITNEAIKATAAITVDEVTYAGETDENGVFVIYNVPQGTHVLTITPEEGSGLEIKSLSDVVVEEGELTELGEISL